MPKKIFTYIVFLAFLNLIGCYSYEGLSYQEFKKTNPDDINSEDIYIITKDSTKYHTSWSTLSVHNDSVFIKGAKYTGEQQTPFKGKVATSDIGLVEITKFDSGTTTIVVLTSVAAVVAFIALMPKNTPSGSGCSDKVELPDYDPYNY